MITDLTFISDVVSCGSYGGGFVLFTSFNILGALLFGALVWYLVSAKLKKPFVRGFAVFALVLAVLFPVVSFSKVVKACGQEYHLGALSFGPFELYSWK